MTRAQDAQGREPGPRWRCPDARRVPELRGRLAAWLAERGGAFYLEMLLAGSQQIRRPGPLPDSAAQLAADEHRRVCGELYWVSGEMTDLARHAGRQLTHVELHEHDLPSSTGFLVFEKPMATVSSAGIDLEIVAVSWGTVTPPLLAREGDYEVPVGADWAQQKAAWFTFYSDPHGFVDAHTRRFARVADTEVTRLRQVGPVMPDNELIWALGQPEDVPSDDDLTSSWGQTAIAACLLMQQPLAAHRTERAPRPARRRLQRAGRPDGQVRLVHVRRPQRTPVQPPEGRNGREYSVQWWVEGHWRRYHVGPGRARVERRWISPYLAGPDDKPIKGTQRIKVWDR
ncbi:hypothetical protein [Actinomadura sp. 7K507]|uniref:hypothetical protein n=1 Tax=Actinomadura sp. 7K507 TaxID=2530365 RepID=UPI001051F488|nr:hypothetical protein [Actinomadura sp. 7K507]TDC79884.1 hypothetical protein E1285_35530 [Actinomadura sp. 7K507]